MNIVSSFVFHCYNCDANRVFVKFRECVNQLVGARLKERGPKQGDVT